MNELLAACRALVGIVEGQPIRWAGDGVRLKDTPEWVAFYCATNRAAAPPSDAPGEAVVYPPDGTVSPFTVINLGHGGVQMGDGIHDGRLPALVFLRDGKGMGHFEELNRQAHPGETLAVVTFANVEGLDVLARTIQRIRDTAFPSPAEQGAREDVSCRHCDDTGWHNGYRENGECPFCYDNRIAPPLAAGRVGVAVDDAMVERACARIHGRNWPELCEANRDELRDDMRLALEAALAGPLVAGEVVTLIDRLIVQDTVSADECEAMASRLGEANPTHNELLRDAAQYRQSAIRLRLVRESLVYADTAKDSCLHGADWTASDEAGGWETRTCNKCGANLGRHRPENPRAIEAPQQESRNG